MIAPLLILALAAAMPGTRHKAQDKPAAPLPSSIDGLPIGAIPQQQLPASGCAAYLWSDGKTHALVAMASADPAQLRLSIDGKIADYARAQQSGAGGFGFGGKTIYRSGDVTAILDMTIQQRAALSDGAMVPAGTITIERSGRDTIVLAVGGLIGCAAQPGGGS